jgi:hypothetical protein
MITKEAKDTVCLSIVTSALMVKGIEFNEIIAIIFTLLFLKEWEK